MEDPYFAGTGSWDVPGLLRRLLAPPPRGDAFTSEPWLFPAVDYRKITSGSGPHAPSHRSPALGPAP